MINNWGNGYVCHWLALYFLPEEEQKMLIEYIKQYPLDKQKFKEALRSLGINVEASQEMPNDSSREGS